MLNPSSRYDILTGLVPKSNIGAKSWKSEIIHKETRYYFFENKWNIEYSHVLESCELNDIVCKQFIFIHRLLMSVKLSRNNKKFKRIQVIRGLRCLILPARPHNYLMEYLWCALALLTHSSWLGITKCLRCAIALLKTVWHSVNAIGMLQRYFMFKHWNNRDNKLVGQCRC